MTGNSKAASVDGTQERGSEAPGRWALQAMWSICVLFQVQWEATDGCQQE